MSPPLIAAGDNLSFWPLGPILRRGGGFFIRRSFKGRKLYAVLVDAYIRKLLVEGFHIEFFLEGGRSRTGKLLPPKFGLLTMIVDAALALPGRKIQFVPVSIGYERIIEGRSYVDEASGGEKQKENLGQLLKTPKILRSRYGRLYVQFGEILDFDGALSEIVAERRDEVPEARPDLRPPERRALIQRIAHRVVYETNRVTVVTPAALLASTLLGHRKRGMAHEALMTRARMMTRTLERMGARFANSLLDDNGKLREGTMVEATRLFIDGKLITRDGEGEDAIYGVPDERRMALEYYKNNVLHFFVPSALISAAIVAGGGEPTGVEKLRHRVRQLSRLFKYEFMYRADATFDEIFDDALAEMLRAGELERLADRIRPVDGEGSEMIVFYAEMIRTYFESYRLAVRGATMVLDRSVSRKEWVKKTLATGRRMYLEGEIELHESLSKLRLDNAVRSLKDLGLVRFLEGDLLGPGEEAPDRETLEQVEARLASSLP
jgi:glycerol-3-phosphate O-acyltransferase